eukprot:3680485-Pyramimonas_sp.AAC.1
MGGESVSLITGSATRTTADYHVHLSVYPEHHNRYIPQRNDNRTILFLHRVDPVLSRWTNVVTLTNLARHLTPRWLVPSQFPCQRNTYSEAVRPVYLVQGHLSRRSLSQLVPILTKMSHLDFEVKVLSRAALPSSIPREKVQHLHSLSEYKYYTEINKCTHIMLLLDPKNRHQAQYFTSKPTSSIAIGIGHRLKIFGHKAAKEAYQLTDLDGHFFNDTTASLLVQFERSVQAYSKSNQGSEGSSIAAMAAQPITPQDDPPHLQLGPGLVRSLPCKQWRAVYFFNKHANFGDEVNKELMSWLTGVSIHSLVFCDQVAPQPTSLPPPSRTLHAYVA